MRQLRRTLSMSQSELACALGVSQSTVSRLEAVEYGAEQLRLRQLRRLARAAERTLPSLVMLLR